MRSPTRRALAAVAATQRSTGRVRPGCGGTAERLRRGTGRKSILNYAKLNGAGTAAAVLGVDGDHPVATKMVYAIGKAHGVELDQGHIKESPSPLPASA
ncbi:MAG: hypothetical protein IPI73_30760 [Betaproteobacteria bacterium]|nr:hypothetical protein [Betaproteobacteria bacterium]